MRLLCIPLYVIYDHIAVGINKQLVTLFQAAISLAVHGELDGFVAFPVHYNGYFPKLDVPSFCLLSAGGGLGDSDRVGYSRVVF